MILWLGHAAFRISAEKRIYIDPRNIKKDSPPADVILLSHHHAGHCSAADIAGIAVPGTVIAGNQRSLDMLGDINAQRFPLVPGQSLSAGGCSVETVPACGPGHAPEDNGMGFIVCVAGQRIYHAGDAGDISGMGNVVCTIALLPVSGGNVLSADAAVDAVALLRPGLAVPMHYGSWTGSITDARRFLAGAAQKGYTAKLLLPA